MLTCAGHMLTLTRNMHNQFKDRQQQALSNSLVAIRNCPQHRIDIDFGRAVNGLFAESARARPIEIDIARPDSLSR